MSEHTTAPAPRVLSLDAGARAEGSQRLADAPVVRRDGQWWLVSRRGALPATDQVFAGELDRLAAALAAADQAVAHLTARRHTRDDVRGLR